VALHYRPTEPDPLWVSQFIFNARNEKLAEIEANIIFLNV
jgi:hypothetical protein